MIVRCPDEMNKFGEIIPSGPFKGKRIEVAPTDDLEMFRSFADEFMGEIFRMELGSYLITDESSLRDLQGVEDLELPDIHRKIREVYSVYVSDIVSGNLVEVLARIHRVPMADRDRQLRYRTKRLTRSIREKPGEYQRSNNS